jgi:leucyl-tRNA synthetase
MSEQVAEADGDGEIPRFRYGASLANHIEARWQDRWEADGTYRVPNPSGPLSDGFDPTRPKLFVMDMFPYPSGDGLHVGHPLGYLGTDVYARYKRMAGFNVLHTLGYDAFGLPAEQYAVQTGQHPRVTTERNIASIRTQLRALGMGHDDRRSVTTIDPAYYRWTQWIFLQIFGSWYDPKPIAPAPSQSWWPSSRRGPAPSPPLSSQRAPTGPRSTSSSDVGPWTRSASCTSTRRRSTGAPGSAPSSPTRR